MLFCPEGNHFSFYLFRIHSRLGFNPSIGSVCKCIQIELCNRCWYCFIEMIFNPCTQDILEKLENFLCSFPRVLGVPLSNDHLLVCVPISFFHFMRAHRREGHSLGTNSFVNIFIRFGSAVHTTAKYLYQFNWSQCI